MNARAPHPTLTVAPAAALIDADITVALSGLAPRSLVTLRAHAQPTPDSSWRSHAVFVTARDGALDLATATPLYGSYLTADANGLLWSLALDATSADRIRDSRFIESGLQPFEIAFTAEVDGVVVAEQTITRIPVLPSVRRVPVRPTADDPAAPVGTLFLPETGSPAPVIVVVPGSNGGIPEALSALYASHGYAALALGYFRAGDELPATLEEIPLEYFERAFDWLAARNDLDARRLTVSGASRGGELALLLGARFPQVRAVVAWVPSGLVNRGFAAIGSAEEKAAWTWQGEPLPYASRSETPAGVDLPLPVRDGGAVYALAALRSLEEVEDVSPIEIPVEQVDGPILLLSGRDDVLWPSAVYSDWIVERLNDHGFAHPVQHLSYEHAGHTLGPANAPATVIVGPDAGQVTAQRTNLGGSPEGIARARADLWPKVLRFLEEVPSR